MSWTDIPHGHVTFGVFAGSSAGAAVAVASDDLTFLRYKLISADTVVVDFRIAKAVEADRNRHVLFSPCHAVASMQRQPSCNVLKRGIA